MPIIELHYILSILFNSIIMIAKLIKTIRMNLLSSFHKHDCGSKIPKFMFWNQNNNIKKIESNCFMPI